MVQVELVYIPAEGSPVYLYLIVKVGTTVAEVLEDSNLFMTNPETRGFPVGIFSKQVPLENLVKSGDRIEVYRPLIIEPKEKRRQRAKDNGWR